MKNDSFVVQCWLWILCGMVVLMVAVGGLTRLTESGLSMVDWKPFMGAIPPLSDADWQGRFDQYRAFPEYQVLRPDMDLHEFKVIFLWEYSHRLLGRAIGLVFLFPYLFFLWKKKIPKGHQLPIFIAFVLGGLQGLMGWFMVMSGLVDNPRVSHFRLAAHFLLALICMAYLAWVALNLHRGKQTLKLTGPMAMFQNALWGWGGLLILQLVYGAFVAGLDAGYAYNTFPRMMGRWIPMGWDSLEPVWMNALSNPATVQFIHRVLAWVLFFGIFALLAFGRSLCLSKAMLHNLYVLCGLVVAQFLLGVFTLVLNMPISLASLHQINSCLVVLVLVNLFHRLKRLPPERACS